MPYPNTVLSAWQLAVIAVVAVGTLAIWLVAVFLAAREPRDAAHAASSAGQAPTGAEPTAVPGSEAEPQGRIAA